MRVAQLISRYSNLLRDIECISYGLAAFVAIFGLRAAYLVATGADFWQSLTPLATALSALLVASNVRQLILKNDIQRGEDRRGAIVKMTHHTMVVVQDLIHHADYLRKADWKEKPAIVFVQSVENMATRYESLLDRELYEFLPGSTLELISKLSGSVLGMKSVSSGVAMLIQTAHPAVTLASINPAASDQLARPLQLLASDLEALDAAVRKQRAELEDS